MRIFGGLKSGDVVYASGNGYGYLTRYIKYEFDRYWVESRNKDGTPHLMSGYQAHTVSEKVVRIIPFIKPYMTKLTVLLTRLLDKDIKTLIKANFLTDRLDMTDEGAQALLTIILEEKRPELVKLAEGEVSYVFIIYHICHMCI